MYNSIVEDDRSVSSTRGQQWYYQVNCITMEKQKLNSNLFTYALTFRNSSDKQPQILCTHTCTHMHAHTYTKDYVL